MPLLKYIICAISVSGVGAYTQYAVPVVSVDADSGRDTSIENLLALDEELLKRQLSPPKPQRINATSSLALPGEDDPSISPNSESSEEGVREANIELVLRSATGERISNGELVRPRRVNRTISELRYEPIPPEELAAVKKLCEAVETLKNADSEPARKSATEAIQRQLAEQFERDLKQREEELAEIQQRLRSLRESLDKRRAARDEIIGLRLQTVINDADGLGFPEERLPSVYQLHSDAPLLQSYQTQ